LLRMICSSHVGFIGVFKRSPGVCYKSPSAPDWAHQNTVAFFA
jgi:hypothetical protein